MIFKNYLNEFVILFFLSFALQVNGLILHRESLEKNEDVDKESYSAHYLYNPSIPCLHTEYLTISNNTIALKWS